jgi:hypothetical protein
VGLGSYLGRGSLVGWIDLHSWQMNSDMLSHLAMVYLWRVPNVEHRTNMAMLKENGGMNAISKYVVGSAGAH